MFCSWICPARLPVELAAWARRLLRRRSKGRAVLSIPHLRWAKYGVLAGGALLAVLTSMNILVIFYPPAIFERQAYYWLTYGTVGWGAIFLAAALLADVFVEGGVWIRMGPMRRRRCAGAPSKGYEDDSRSQGCHEKSDGVHVASPCSATSAGAARTGTA